MEKYDKIKKLINSRQYSKAEKELKKIIEINRLDEAEYLEEIFVLFLNLENGLRNFTPFLNVSEVPTGEINTSDSYSRKFFYFLYILNCSGGMRLVKPYLSKLKVNRMLEYRFLGGMYFYNLDFINAIQCYQKSLELIKDDFNEFQHKFLMGNLAAAYLYTEQYQNYEHHKEFCLKRSSNSPVMERVFLLYDIIKNLQLKNLEEARRVYDKCYRLMYFEEGLTPANILFYKVIKSSIEQDEEGFKNNLSILHQSHLKKIESFEKNPERFFSVKAYLIAVGGFSEEVFSEVINMNNETYPMESFKVFNLEFDFSKVKSVGNKKADNYINLASQEYEINGVKGILLKNEIKAIYFLVRAGAYGLSYESIASLIYDDTEVQVLFLIKDRIKQIIHRIKTVYGLNVTTKNFRAYLNKKDLNSFYITAEGPLRLPPKFDLQQFKNHFNISHSKAKKVLSDFVDNGFLKRELVARKNSYKQLF